MASPRVLLFGGNGKLGRAITSQMLAKNWTVVSVIRNNAQRESILQLGKAYQAKLEVMMLDLEALNNDGSATKLLDTAKANIVVYAASSMTNPDAVDRDASKRIIKAATSHPSISKYLLISFPASRREAAPWWSEKDCQDYMEEKSSYPMIQQAKLDADEYLVAMAHARAIRGDAAFQAISLRPSWLLNSKGTGKVQLGKAGSLGQVTRADVAAVAVALLSRDDTRGWFDLFQGESDIDEAVERVVREGINCIEGEDLEHIHALAS